MLIRELMTPNPAVLTPHMALPDALKLMKEKNVHRMPVVDSQGKLVGIIAETDLHNAAPSQAWFFETEKGRREILFRRIGQNEASTIHVCRELAAAQKEFHAIRGGQYAQVILSDEGQHNGLYWKTADREPQSPIGPLVAGAETRADGPAGAPTPYRGYQYRILTRQGSSAPGGAQNYLADGKLTVGFAFVAYPASYRSSGVMTFIVNQAGVVYEKDLGRRTRALALAMKAYNPGPGWKMAEGQEKDPD
jgi:hypothetical protein